jgi:hypothetical protein
MELAGAPVLTGQTKNCGEITAVANVQKLSLSFDSRIVVMRSDSLFSESSSAKSSAEIHKLPRIVEDCLSYCDTISDYF